METSRLRTGTPVTSCPPTRTRPLVGVSSPAMMRIKLVLPACVAPSSTVTAPLCNARLMGYNQDSAPTALLTPSNTICITPPFTVCVRYFSIIVLFLSILMMVFP